MKKEIYAAFSEGMVGTFFGLVSALYFTNNNLLVLCIGGVSGVISKIFIPKFICFLDEKIKQYKDSNIQKIKISSIRIITLSTIFIFSLILAAYCTVDTYKKGEVLITTANPNLRKSTTINPESEIRTIEKGEKLTYIRKTWRRYRIHDNNLNVTYFDFWRKVEADNGDEGWIFGVFLENIKDE